MSARPSSTRNAGSAYSNLAGFPPTWTNVVVIFLIFRVLDVVKIWPASYCDREMPGGAGVVLDDVVSGIYANLLARIIL